MQERQGSSELRVPKLRVPKLPVSAGNRSGWLRASALGVALLGPGCAGDASNPEPAPPSSARPVPAISGGTLLVSRDGTTAVASDPDRDRVYLVDLQQAAVRATVTLEPGDEPGRVIEDGGGRMHVALRGGGAVLSLDPRDGRVIARRALCPAPRGLAWDAGRSLLHVACAGGELVSIAPEGETPTRSLRLERDLRDVLVRGDKLLVSSFRRADLLVVTDSGVAERLRPPAARAAFNTFGGRKPGVPGMGSVGGPDDANASAAVAWRLVPGGAGKAFLLHQRGVDEEIGTQPNAYGSGPGCAGIVETAVTTVEEDGTVARVRSGAALGNAVLAVDMAVSPDGRQLAVVAAGNAGSEQQVLFYETEGATAPPTPDKPCVPGGPAPMPGNPPDGGVAVDGGDVDGGMPIEDPVIEYRPPNGEVIAVAYDPRGHILVQSRQPATLQILTKRSAPIVLSTDVRADVGHQLFHAATKGRLACASCHPEGGEDGRTWKFFGLGARRTQSLRGGIMDTAPFHWNGDMPTLEHLMHDVFQGRMAGPKVERPQLEALGGWLDKLPEVKTSAWNDRAAITRGKALFESATVACASCHSGKDFTNGASFDVGTGGTFQVPQLRNLAFRAPFMHDGCAGTLTERFTKCGGGDKHGVTSQLTQAQIADLVAYLESL